MSAASNNIEYLEYQKLAADLFRKFCEKEAANQSTANYNLNYDTFVCQFSSMCYNNNKDENAKAEIRSSGLRCLATMVRRLVPDDCLRATFLWDNMNKIVPALLYIMHEKSIESMDKTRKPQDNDDELIDEENLIRYLDGDFFVHSRTQQNLNDIEYDGGEVTFHKNDLDSVRVEFTRKMDNQYHNKQLETSIGKSSSKSSQSSADDEHGAMLVERKYSTKTLDSSVIDPDHEAKMLLKHLSSKADFTTISKIVKPILDYLDTSKASGWEYTSFVRCIFLILMYNVKQQHAIVIKELIKHLDSHINSSAKLKRQIISAISTCIRTAAMHSVGTAGQIIEIFTYLIKHLKTSVEKQSQLRLQLLQKPSASTIPNKSVGTALLTSTALEPQIFKIQNDINEEANLQAKIIEAMGQFTVNLPDYSKNEVVMLIANQITSQHFNYTDLTSINSVGNNSSAAHQNAKDLLNTQLRAKYFECLHEICAKYRPQQLFSAFTSISFLEDILRLTLVADWASSRKAHEIIQLLLDKYQTMSKIKKLKPSIFNDFLAKTITTINNKLNKSSNSNLYHKNVPNASNTSLHKVINEAQESQSSVKSSLTSLPKQTRNQSFLSQLDLSDSKFMISREDIQFMRKYGRILLGHLNESLFLLNNRRENFESIYITTTLIVIGLFNENEFLIELIRFGFHVQELALLNYEHSTFSFNLQCNVHKFVCAYFLLLAKSSGIEAMYDYCSLICEKRKTKGLYHYIYPEYVLMETPTMTDSGIHSTRTSMTELEVEFKRDLQQSAKEYYNLVDEHQKNKNEREDIVIAKEKENQSAVSPKMAPWLFCKKTIADILEKSGFQTSALFNQNKDFSLSFSYLQQTVKTVQSALKYRSPYSNSFDSLSNIRHEASSHNIAGIQGGTHSRIGSKSGQVIRESSSFPNGQTPRRSLDNESYMDDDTSYDSMSQVSIDQNYNDNNKLFFIDANTEENNQLTVDSLNFSNRQQYQDISSFETIKRVLLNGSNNRMSGAASVLTGSGTNGTIIAPSSSASIVKIAQQRNHNTENNNTNASSNDDLDSNNSTETLENSMKIISDFKQKPFDELKQTLLRSNQVYVNQEKYHQVFDSISKEITVNSRNPIDQVNTNQISNGTNSNNGYGNVSNNSSLYGSNGNLNDGNAAISNGTVYKETNFQQKLVPLNDIEFPQLFMY
jgi:hypothetical protein